MTPIPAAVQRLKLCSAFKGYAMGVMGCIETTTAKEVMIVDDDYTHTVTDSADEVRCCRCINPEERELVVLPIDKRLVSQRVGGMCDGAVFDTERFVFLEFKDKADGKTHASVESTYKKAAKQLAAGVMLFDEKLNAVGVNLRHEVEVECRMIVRETFPRSKATEQSLRVAFADEQRVALSFDRTVHFGAEAGAKS